MRYSKNRKILVTIVKCACLLIMLLLSVSVLYCQITEADSLFFRVNSIEKDTSLDSTEKLKALYQLKNKADKIRKANDTGYVVLLIKIALNETIVKKNYNSAIANSLQALALNKRLQHPVSDHILINCCYNLATYYTNTTQQNKAILFYDSVLALCKEPDPDGYIMESRFRKAAFYATSGDYDKQFDECTMGIIQALKKKDTALLIPFFNQRVKALIYLAQYDKALADIKTVIPMEKAKGNDNWLASSYQSMADIYMAKGENKEAEKYYLKVIKVRPQLPDFYERTASDYNKLAIFYSKNIKDFSKAKENYQKTLAYASKCLPAVKPTYVLAAYVNFGDFYQQQKKIPESIACYKHAFEQLQFYTKDILFTNPSLSALSLFESMPDMFILLSNKTDLLFTLYNQNKEPKYLEACIKTALLTDSIITLNRHQNISEGSKLYWRDESRDFFTEIIEACYLANDVKDAFYFMEKSRAVLLNDKWNELSANIHLPAQESEKREHFQSVIVKQKQTLSELQQTSIQYNDAQTNLLLTIDSLENFIKSLEKKYPAYYQNKYADNVPPLQSLQAYLAKNNQSFVYYFMNDTATYALGIMKNKASFIKISKANFDSHQLSTFIHLCSNKQALIKDYDTYQSLAQTIYNKLFEPLHIPKGNVAICTDNFFIPFEALCSDDKGKNYLLYKYRFSYVYSARSLLKSFPKSPSSGDFIGFAPVSFSRSLHVLDLKESAYALQNAAEYYNNNTLFTQQQATRNNFISQASHYSVVTIFSHARADTTGTEPVLYMQDSLVHLSDLQRLNNPSTQFVLLSACQTNIGKNATGEGIYSLARGFASAGIPSVSATLWKADEGAVYEISTKFNEYLSKGMNKDEALQKAKIWYLKANEDNENSMPFFWANMVLIGSSQPVSLTTANHLWDWVWSFALLLAATGVWLYFRYKNKKASATSLNDTLLL